MAEQHEALLDLRGVTKMFGAGDRAVPVLEGIDLQIASGEFVALLGPSGCGKSTLIRIMAGLIAPSHGQVLYRGAPVVGVNPRAAMVFQSFALFPWLTLLENVAVALAASPLDPVERRRRCLHLIDLVGLHGFEGAFPRELSGGMRQRAGFARALAGEPELLCLDEPFSALDVLTADTLRRELLSFWLDQTFPLKTAVLVSHSIEDACLLADRVILLTKKPGRIAAGIPVDLPHPRDPKADGFRALVDQIYQVLTGSEAHRPPRPAAAGRLRPLPHAPLGMLAGLLELVADRGGREDLHDLSADLRLEVDQLLPITEAAQLLQLATITEGDLVLTERGTAYVAADPVERKVLFQRQVRELPVVALVLRLLRERRTGRLSGAFVQELLAKHFSEGEAPLQVQRLIEWGRYAELFAYDAGAGELILEAAEANEHP